ncbi:hypothetical protein [Micromonospora vulcania]|uniref:Uncharacterized protein n=1 Tax=Micromonospora vulcania TaxID=1441873 RepID=A0ABW1HAA5_9ACTN
MHIVPNWLRRLARRPDALPPVPPGTSQRIQTREQQAARARLIDQARRRAAETRYDGPAR